MSVKLLRSLGLAVSVLAIGSASFAAVRDVEMTQGTNPAGQAMGESTVSDIGTAAMDSAIPNWAAPQFLGMPAGLTGSSRMDLSGKTSAKATLNLATFVPIAPCRLVDTRTGTGGSAVPFGPANETRSYTVPGTCGIPVGSNRLTAVSLAITTPPTISSGDVSVAAFGASLTTTVAMVYAANIWNSATGTPAVDSLGQFSIAVRPTPASTTHVVIDINGYYAKLDSGNTTDFMSLIGNYNSDGGMLYVQNTGSVGAAVRAVSGIGSADVRLAQGANAIDVASGALRVRGAGLNTGGMVYVQNASAANTCILGSFSYTFIVNPQTDGDPNAILIAGTSLFAFPGGSTGVTDLVNANLVYYQASATCGSTSTLNRWAFFRTSANPFTIGVKYPVLIVNTQ